MPQIILTIVFLMAGTRSLASPITQAASERWGRDRLRKEIDDMLFERTAVSGKPEIIKIELCLLAMEFLKPEHPEYPEKVFVCGDSANGASLVVRAMASGKQTAKSVHAYLTK